MKHTKLILFSIVFLVLSSIAYSEEGNYSIYGISKNNTASQWVKCTISEEGWKTCTYDIEDFKSVKPNKFRFLNQSYCKNWRFQEARGIQGVSIEYILPNGSIYTSCNTDNLYEVCNIKKEIVGIKMGILAVRIERDPLTKQPTFEHYAKGEIRCTQIKKAPSLTGPPEGPAVVDYNNLDITLTSSSQIPIDKDLVHFIAKSTNPKVKFYFHYANSDHDTVDSDTAASGFDIKACLDDNQNNKCDVDENADLNEANCIAAGIDGQWLNYDANPATFIDNCCGDDPPRPPFKEDNDGISYDEGRLINNDFLCAHFPKTNRYEWLLRNQTAGIYRIPGDIYNISYGKFDVMSDGDNWIACDSKADGTGGRDVFSAGGGVFTGPTASDKEIIAYGSGRPGELSHEYICYTDPDTDIEHFAECAGDSKEYNDNPNTETKYAGQSIETAPTERTRVQWELEAEWAPKHTTPIRRDDWTINLSDYRGDFGGVTGCSIFDGTIVYVEGINKTTKNCAKVDEDEEFVYCECQIEEFTYEQESQTLTRTINLLNIPYQISSTESALPIEKEEFNVNYTIVSDNSALVDFSFSPTESITTKQAEYYIEQKWRWWRGYEEVIHREDLPIYAIPVSETITGKISYFCTNKGKWVTDLDNTDKDTCESFLLEWTGSKCCGDETGDTYNDIWWQDFSNQIGGCFDEKKVFHNHVLKYTNIVEDSNFSDILNKWTRIGDASSDPEFGLVLEYSGDGVSQDITERLMPGEYLLTTAFQAELQDSNVSVSVEVDGQIHTLSVEKKYITPKIEKLIFTVPQGFSNVIVRADSHIDNQLSYVNYITVHQLTTKIMNHNGSFYGCLMQDDEITYYKDNNGNNLISADKNLNICNAVGTHFCSPDGNFQSNTFGGIFIDPRNHSTYLPQDYIDYITETTPEITQGSCCPETMCWNGSICVPTETQAILQNPIEFEDTVYSCMEGNWAKSMNKSTWDKEDYGNCPSDTQCLVDPIGNSANNDLPEEYKGDLAHSTNPQCIESGQYIEDHYCDNGNWSSRTKLLAKYLLTIPDDGLETDYAIYCGDHTSTLNKYDYSSEQGRAIEEYILGEKIPLYLTYFTYICPYLGYDGSTCTNNFCILRYGDQIVAATSLNQPLDVDELSFLEALGKDSDYCDNPTTTEDSDFKNCEEEGIVWYNESLNLIIFSKQEIDLTRKGLFERLLDLFIHPIQSFIALINLESESTVPLAYEAQDYNNFYAAVEAGKTINAIFEKRITPKFLVADYKGFSQDICIAIETYDDSKWPDTDVISCNETEDSTYQVYSKEEISLDLLWKDLTAKLRIT
ncbi:hypothetical protein KY332_02425 [Candidatus Woesearchaeota archaeon]|nr:hypothetical protein [Candidatus Woesearchaeota archaeon]